MVLSRSKRDRICSAMQVQVLRSLRACATGGTAAEKPPVSVSTDPAASQRNRRATAPRDDLLSRNPRLGRVYGDRDTGSTTLSTAGGGTYGSGG